MGVMGVEKAGKGENGKKKGRESLLLEVLQALSKGEGEEVEFKEDSNEVYKKIGREVAAMANTAGGIILIGVSDSGEIKGLQRPVEKAMKKVSDALLALTPVPTVKMEAVEINRKPLLAVKVERSPTLVSVGSVAYVRIGSNIRPLTLSEVVERLINERRVFFDALPSGIPLRKADRVLLETFIEKRKARGLPGSLREEDLRKMGIVVEVEGKAYLTNAGALAFYRQPEESIPMAYVRAVEQRGRDTLSLIEEIHGPVGEQIEQALEVVESHNPLVEFRNPRGRRLAVRRFPPFVLREAIINAVAHKNYAMPSPIYITFTGDAISVKNPGKLPEGVLRKPMHLPTNPILSEILFVLGYIEAFGTGIPRMLEEVKHHPWAELEFRSTEGMVEVVVRSTERSVEGLLSFLAVPRTSSEVAAFLGVSKPTVLNLLKGLMKEGLVVAEGEGRGRKYRVAKG